MLPNWLYGKSKSKLAELLGGGGTPSDYNQVKAQVTQNAEDIALLNNTVEGKVDWSDYSELGAVNELTHKAVTDTSGTVKFTVNNDMSITVSASSYPVTVSSTTSLFLYGSNSAAVPNIFKGKKLTGCPSGGATEKYKIVAQEFSSATPSGSTAEQSDVGEGATINNGDYIRIYIRIASGYELTEPITFYPMIAPASYNGGYVPPAKTNKELTDESKLITLQAIKNDSIVGSSFIVKVRKQYNAVYISGYFNTAAAANRNDLLFTISGLTFLDANDHFYATIMSTPGATLFAEIYSDGTVKLASETAMPSGYYTINGVLLVK